MRTAMAPADVHEGEPVLRDDTRTGAERPGCPHAGLVDLAAAYRTEAANLAAVTEQLRDHRRQQSLLDADWRAWNVAHDRTNQAREALLKHAAGDRS